MKTRSWLILTATVALGGLGAAVAAGQFDQNPAPKSGDAAAQKAAEQPQPKGTADPRAADAAEVRKATASFLKALEAGDAKAVAAHFTDQGEFIGADGDAIRGRDAIAKSYAEFLKDNPKLKVVGTDLDTLKFVSRDSAIEEGKVKVQKLGGETTVNRYTILHVREDGKWLLAIVREGRPESTQLADLDWLVGKWTAGRDGVDMQSEFEWVLGKAFLQMRFTVKIKGEETKGIQMLGRDPVTGVLRSWTFESEGGFGHATWVRDGKSWNAEATGVQGDGSILTATNVMTRVDDDTFSWHSTRRTIDGTDLGDLPPVRVTRVKAGK